MGHFSMEKSLNPGSVLGGNQHNTTKSNALVWETGGFTSNGAATKNFNGTFTLCTETVQGSNTFKIQVGTMKSGSFGNSPNVSASVVVKMLWWKR